MKQNKPSNIAISVAVLSLFLLACGSTSAVKEAANSNAAAQPAGPTATQAAVTEAPTAAPAPTNTAAPTPTEVPAEPIVFEGSGDSIKDLPDLKPSIVKISGNAGNSFFAVQVLGEDNQPIDLLVNQTAKYEGVRPIAFNETQKGKRLKIDAKGKWRIEILPLSSARRETLPANITGSGDEVLVLDGKPDLAKIKGNAKKRFFAVLGYGGSFPNLLVNTTDVYEGEVALGPDDVVIVVQADGEWSMEISAK